MYRASNGTTVVSLGLSNSLYPVKEVEKINAVHISVKDE